MPEARDDVATSLLAVTIESLRTNVLFAESKFNSEARSYEWWKKLLLAIGVLAVLTVGILVARLWMGSANIADLAGVAALIFEGAAATYVTKRKNEAGQSADAAYNTFTTLRQELEQNTNIYQLAVR